MSTEVIMEDAESINAKDGRRAERRVTHMTKKVSRTAVTQVVRKRHEGSTRKMKRLKVKMGKAAQKGLFRGVQSLESKVKMQAMQTGIIGTKAKVIDHRYGAGERNEQRARQNQNRQLAQPAGRSQELLAA